MKYCYLLSYLLKVRGITRGSDFLVHCTYSQFSKWRPSAILDFHIFAIFIKNSNYHLFLHSRAKFGEDRMIWGRVIVYFQFSNGPSWIWYDVIADHPWLVFDGPNIVLKLHVDRVYTLQDNAIFIFGPFGLKLPIHAHFGGVLGAITPKWIPILSQPVKGLSLGKNTSYEP